MSGGRAMVELMKIVMTGNKMASDFMIRFSLGFRETQGIKWRVEDSGRKLRLMKG